MLWLLFYACLWAALFLVCEIVIENLYFR